MEFIRGYSTVVMRIGNIMLKWNIYAKLIILAIVDAINEECGNGEGQAYPL